MTSDRELDTLTRAVEDHPDIVELRVRLAAALAERGRIGEALLHAGEALRREPAHPGAREIVARLGTAMGPADEPATSDQELTGQKPTGLEPCTDVDFDWGRAEAEMQGVIDAEYVATTGPGSAVPPAPLSSTLLADVAGMGDVKQQIELSFLGPLRNPDLARAYGTGAGGGLLLYGPPGCGKTFIASAIAGELGARFHSIGIPDVVDMATGATEQTLHEVFEQARSSSPSMIFFDELDALGRKRAQLHGSSVLRQLVTQLLTELDAASRTDGVFVLGATNHPWDLDSALRRPGRFDRMLFVAPPDEQARAALIRSNLAGRPIAGIDLAETVAATSGYSGADVAFLCRSAAQRAMADSAADGAPRWITMDDLRAAARGITPSTGSWFSLARNVVEFGNPDGSFDDLAAYLRRMRRRR